MKQGKVEKTQLLTVEGMVLVELSDCMQVRLLMARRCLDHA